MIKKIIVSLTFLLLLTSCVETVVVSSVVASNFMVKEKGFSDSRQDVNITSRILKKYSVSGLKNPGNSIDVIVDEQRVLLTGIVSDPRMVSKAVDLAWEVKGVKEVIDEVQVAKNKSKFNGFRTYSYDALVTAQVKTRAIFNKDISLVNIKVNTVNNVVYLIGISQDDYEIDKITKMVAKTRGVRKVVSHIIKINDQRRRA